MLIDEAQSQIANRKSQIDLPGFALIADGFTNPGVASRARAAVEAGVPWVHLRDHEATSKAFEQAAREQVRAIRDVSNGTVISINANVGVAETLGTGVHVGRRGPSVEEARAALGKEALVGFSAHSRHEAEEAAQSGADYCFFSPVFPTASKPGHPGTGIDALQEVCTAAPLPVLALGGITPERVASCQAAGAQGVAVLSGILHADDPAQATRRYLTEIENRQSKI